MSQPSSSSMRPGVVGMGWFVASDAVMFVALLVTCRMLAADAGWEPSFGADTAAQTGLLVTTSVIVSRFMGARWAPLAVVLLGAAFCAVTALEYRSLVAAAGALDDADTLAAAGFFAVTGFHLVHVAVGTIAAGVTGRGGLSRPLAIYWNFVDVAWLAIISTLYL